MMANMSKMNHEWSLLLQAPKKFSKDIVLLHQEIIFAKLQECIVDLYI